MWIFLRGFSLSSHIEVLCVFWYNNLERWACSLCSVRLPLQLRCRKYPKLTQCHLLAPWAGLAAGLAPGLAPALALSRRNLGLPPSCPCSRHDVPHTQPFQVPTPQDPTIATRHLIPVLLPERPRERWLASALQIIAYDSRLGGLACPMLGTATVELAGKLPWCMQRASDEAGSVQCPATEDAPVPAWYDVESKLNAFGQPRIEADNKDGIGQGTPRAQAVFERPTALQGEAPREADEEMLVRLEAEDKPFGDSVTLDENNSMDGDWIIHNHRVGWHSVTKEGWRGRKVEHLGGKGLIKKYVSTDWKSTNSQLTDPREAECS